MSVEKNIELIISYLNNELPEIQRIEVEYWINQSDVNRRFFEKIKSDWSTNREEDDSFNLDESQILKEIHPKIQKKPRKLNLFLRIAASVIILLSIGSIFYFNFRNSKSTEEFVCISNIQSNKLKHILPDSSILWIKKNSSIKYEKTFTKRCVAMNGEVYFIVTPDKNRPFSIDTKTTRIEVVGTEFNVREDLKTTVSVTKGIVRFMNLEKTSTIELKANEEGVFDKNENKIKKNYNNSINYNSWLTETLIFKDEPLSKVCQSLSDAYSAKIVLENAKDSTKLLNAKFEKQPLNEIIESINFVLDTKLIVKK